MKRPYQFKAQCLVCDHKGTVLHNSKEEYQEVNVCPKCKGAFVDTWNLAKYKNETINEIEISNEMIPLIEEALGFTLYDWQRAYLLEEQHVKPTERASGRTTAYIVKLLLTNREPINIKFEAMKYKDHQGVQYTHFFRNFMREIDEKLNAVGLPTCSVKPKPIKGITIDAGVNTHLQLKLRAIAKHAEALANELDTIDNESYITNGVAEEIKRTMANF